MQKNNTILCIWCNAMYLRGLRFKKIYILLLLYIIVAPLCTAFLIRIDFYKAHHPEKRGVLWLAWKFQACDGRGMPHTTLGNTQRLHDMAAVATIQQRE